MSGKVEWKKLSVYGAYRAMRLASFGDLLIPRKGFSKLPVAQDTEPDHHAFASLAAGHSRADEDVP